LLLLFPVAVAAVAVAAAAVAVAPAVALLVDSRATGSCTLLQLMCSTVQHELAVYVLDLQMQSLSV
jgi:hypothetical protein